MIQQFKIYLYGVIIFGLILFLYFWHYKPIFELEEVKKELKEKEIIIDLSQFETKKEVFETKHKAVKETLQKKEDKHEKDIDLNVGVHTVIFE